MTAARIEPADTHYSANYYLSARARAAVGWRLRPPRTSLARLPRVAASRRSAPFATRPHRAVTEVALVAAPPALLVSAGEAALRRDTPQAVVLTTGQYAVAPGPAGSVPLVAVAVPRWPGPRRRRRSASRSSSPRPWTRCACPRSVLIHVHRPDLG